ncbi:MAG: hypothetical protein AB7H93_23505 [Vicinamibacterales bacterium]
MSPDAWATERKLSNAALGRLLGCSAEMARLHRLGRFVPRPALVRRWLEISDGRVRPEDFYVAADRGEA